MPTRSFALASLAGFSLLALGVSSVGNAVAQTPPPPRASVTVDLQNADVRDALRDLFRDAHVSYSIDPMVQGRITTHLKSVSFETALQNIARQVDATYRVEGGVYQVVPQRGPSFGFTGTILGSGTHVEGFGAPPPAPEGATAMIADGASLFLLRGDTVYKVDKRSMRLVGQVSLPTDEGRRTRAPGSLGAG